MVHRKARICKCHGGAVVRRKCSDRDDALVVGPRGHRVATAKSPVASGQLARLSCIRGTHMRSIVHRELGDPAQVLRLEQTPVPVLGPKQTLGRTSYAPIHPGDLLGVKGSPAAGTPPAIGSDGRVPGFEGAGVLTEVGRGVDPASGVKLGARVAFFPAGSTWSEQVAVPVGSTVPLPDNVPDAIGAQMLINTVTALTVLRTAHDSLPPDARENVVAIVTAAGSAVGRLIVKLLIERGVFPIR